MVVIVAMVSCGVGGVGVTAPVPLERPNERLVDATEYPFRQWARPDAIPPIYTPSFALADQVGLEDDELVQGVAWGGEAKAYPVTVMQFRELVNDELAGVPILVSW